jgi:hypothetical protein
MSNCHSYCGMSKHCRFDDGEEGRNQDECRMYDVLDAVVQDSRIKGRWKDEYQAEDLPCGEAGKEVPERKKHGDRGAVVE